MIKIKNKNVSTLNLNLKYHISKFFIFTLVFMQLNFDSFDKVEFQ